VENYERQLKESGLGKTMFDNYSSLKSTGNKVQDWVYTTSTLPPAINYTASALTGATNA